MEVVQAILIVVGIFVVFPAIVIGFGIRWDARLRATARGHLTKTGTTQSSSADSVQQVLRRGGDL